MAKLESKATGTSTTSLLIVPVEPTLEGPLDSYQLCILEDNTVVFDKTYTVHDWQLGHSYMFRIARAFEQAIKLIDLRSDLCLSPPDVASAKFNLPVTIREDINWLEVILWGKTIKGEAYVFVEVYLQTEPEGPDTPLIPFVCRRFSCFPEAAEKFGRALKEECEIAREKRLALDIPAQDD